MSTKVDWNGGHMTREAVISDCGKYRYLLGRNWDERRSCAFVMLNPSTADADIDDPTIRKCIGFASRWGYGGIVVANLFAWRATKPAELRRTDDPIGPDNLKWLKSICNMHRIVCAWGAHASLASQKHMAAVYDAIGGRLSCLGVTDHGHPRHPLMLTYGTNLRPWEPHAS